MKKIVSVWLAVMSLGIWVACGSGNKDGARITNKPNNQKIDDKLNLNCPTDLGKFEDSQRKEVLIKASSPGVIEISLEGVVQASTGTTVELENGRVKVTAVCSNGKIITTALMGNQRTDSEYSLTSTELQIKAGGKVNRFRRTSTDRVAPSASLPAGSGGRGRPGAPLPGAPGVSTPSTSGGSPAVGIIPPVANTIAIAGTPAVAASPGVVLDSPEPSGRTD